MAVHGDYNGDTFVAFIDVSGFTYMIRNEESRAINALRTLYKSGFEYIAYGQTDINDNNKNPKIEGIFVSDCGILFIREGDLIDRFNSLLTAIRIINREMIRERYLLTTSIAYGKFIYKDRIEISGIDKNMIYGDAYVSAFVDNEYSSPKMQPGECRILKRGLPQEVITKIEHNQSNERFSLIKEREGDNNHYYYYWSLENREDIESFKKHYKDAYNSRYINILEVLRNSFN